MPDFTKIPRGKPVRGARALANAFYGDPEKTSAIYNIDRAAYGIIALQGQLTGFEGWIHAALAERANAGERLRRGPGEKARSARKAGEDGEAA